MSSGGTEFDYFSAESVAQAAKEQREKCLLLHEERSKAWREMNDAIAQHRFLVDATRAADEHEHELVHRLSELCRAQAIEMVG